MNMEIVSAFFVDSLALVALWKLLLRTPKTSRYTRSVSLSFAISAEVDGVSLWILILECFIVLSIKNKLLLNQANINSVKIYQMNINK